MGKLFSLPSPFRKRAGAKKSDGAVLPELSEQTKEYLRSVRLWSDIYCGRAPWLKGGGTGLNLASDIAGELARLTVSELNMNLECEDGERKEALEGALEKVSASLKVWCEYACACGGVILKPCPTKNGIGISCVLPGDFIPLGFEDGKMNSAVFFDRVISNGRYYLRAEEHYPTEDGYLILNHAFVSERGAEASDAGFRRSVPLDEVPQWSGIESRTVIAGLDRPLFAYFGIPLGNIGDMRSPLGASVFSRAVGLLCEADKQFGRLMWEFEGGELAVDVSEDAFKLDSEGRPVLPSGKERLYRPNNLDAGAGGDEVLRVFSPALRDVSIINGLNRVVMFIEDACGIARGTFSDPNTVSKTATEVRSMRQRTFSTVSVIQRSLDSALHALVGAANAVCDLYGIGEHCIPSLGIIWGDSVLTDSDETRARDLSEFSAGLMSREEFREKWYGKTDEMPNEGKEEET